MVSRYHGIISCTGHFKTSYHTVWAYSYGHLLVITGYKWDYTCYKWDYK